MTIFLMVHFLIKISDMKKDKAEKLKNLREYMVEYRKNNQQRIKAQKNKCRKMSQDIFIMDCF